MEPENGNLEDYFLYSPVAQWLVPCTSSRVYLPRMVTEDEHLFSYWCTMTGSIVSFLTFIFWRPHQLVFFDRMCIPENDSQLKAEAWFCAPVESGIWTWTRIFMHVSICSS